MPVWQAVIGCAVICAGVLVALGDAAIITGPEQLPYLYAIGFGNTVLGCLVSRPKYSLHSRLAIIGIAHVYALYTWLLFPALLRATVRQLRARDDWNRTDRVPIEALSAVNAPAELRERPSVLSRNRC